MKRYLPLSLFILIVFMLLVAPGMRAATRTWTGLSPNTNAWGDARNWLSNLSPSMGDYVVFPNGALQKFNFNDLPVNNLLQLSGIIFGDGGYFILGETVTLTNSGIYATNTSSDQNVWASLLKLDGASTQQFDAVNAGTALLVSQLDLNGKTLFLNGAGTNWLSDVLMDSQGGAQLVANGPGVFMFTVSDGNNSFRGPIQAGLGTNVFNGSVKHSPISWVAGTLGGTGVVGRVTSMNSPDPKRLVPGFSGPGSLTISNLVLDPSVTVAFKINGTNLQTDYSHINIGVDGGFAGADLGFATLSVSFPTNFSPPLGSSFYLFQTDVHSLISGIFTNMPEGSTITNNGIVYELSYSFGHGVTLTAAGVSSTGVLRYWTGFGGTGLWSTPQNWQNNSVPQPGDTILFEQSHISASFIVSTNDLPNDTIFDSIHFQILQASSRIMMTFGNSFRLNSGVFLEATPGNSQTGTGTFAISNHITLNNAQLVTNSLPASLYLGALDLGANVLSVDAQLANGQVIFDGSVTGAGVLQINAGNGTVALHASNSITGSIEVNGGTLLAQHPQAFGSPSAGPVHVGASGVLNLFPTSSAPFTGSSIALAGTLSNGTPAFDFSLAIPLLVSGSNALVITPPATLRTISLSGPITNNTQLTVSQHSGFGMVNLPAGASILGGGVLRVTNNSASASGDAFNADGILHNAILADAGIDIVELSGAGQVDSLICTNCNLQPGSSADSALAFNPLSVGTLLMANAQNHSAILSINLFPNRPGGGPTNTTIIVTNAPTLGSAQLFLNAKTNLAPNQQFTILRNLSSAPVTNTFLNMPESAAVLPANGNLGVCITYVGGAGHDVVLTVLSNHPPIFTTPTNTVFFNVLSNNIYTNAFSDFEQAGESFSWTNLTALPTGLVLNTNTGVMSWTPAINQAPSTNIIVVKVTDSGSPPLSATGQVTISVRQLNQAPVPVQIPNPTNVLAGHTLTIQLQANDPDNPPDTPIWGASSLPAGASITTSGLFTYTPGEFVFGTNSATVFVYDFNSNDANPTSPTNFMTFNIVITRNRIVTNTNNFGLGSLSNAIVEIGTNASGGHIEFNIPGTGPFRIAPTNALPFLRDNTYLDGYTQPGAQPNTNSIGTSAKLMIELGGEYLHADAGALDAGRGSSITIRGLCINSFTNNLGEAAILSSACFVLDCTHGGIAVEGCFIGTDTTGANAVPNSQAMNFGCACNCRIGGPDLSQRNLISGNLSHAVAVGGFGANNNIVQNNLIGTDRTGTSALGNGGYGIIINGFSGSGKGLVADNVICANALYGINEAETSDLIVRNKIGVGADGVTPLGNGNDGIYLNGVGNTVGGTNAAEANLIANNNGFGVEIVGQALTVLGNSIFRNTGRGIRLDSSANTNQSAPVLTAATATSASGTLTSQNNETYRIELFYSPDFNPNGQPQAKTFLGATNVTTGSNSNANFSITFTQAVPSGFFTATATDPVGNTSGISDGLAISVPRLNIALVSGQARVLWLTNFSTFVLQSNASVAQSNGWGDVTGVPGVTGSNFFRDFSPPGASPRFFRLRSQ